jgi:adenosylcobinamide-phosphate synthase
MSFYTTLLILVGALALDVVAGYPTSLYKRIGHPVSWIGALLNGADKRLNRDGLSAGTRKTLGALALGVIVAAVALLAYVVEHFLLGSGLGKTVLIILASVLFAGRSLYDHVADVASALEREGYEPARRAVGLIVGRNPETLDEHGIARAAIESLAENASDGVVAPAFWFAVLGLPGLAAYKAINTADSMIGHRTAKHEAFGWAAAKVDDAVNLPASRLTGLLFAAAASVLPAASGKSALRAMPRDAPKHRSPNAGWPESAMAGALGLKLNGPKTYGDRLIDDAYMGDGRREATAADIRRALRLASAAWALMVVALLAVALIARG